MASQYEFFQFEIGEAVCLRKSSREDIPATKVQMVTETSTPVSIMNGHVALWMAAGRSFKDRFPTIPSGAVGLIVDIIDDAQKCVILVNDELVAVSNVFIRPLPKE